MKKMMVLAVVMMCAICTYAQDAGTLVNDYMKIKDALVSSNGTAAAKAIQVFYNAANSESVYKEKAAMLKAAAAMRNAGNSIEKQRKAFNALSIPMWEMTERNMVPGVYYQYCPMIKGYWLSREQEIKNPYYGNAMLTCGTVKAKTDSKEPN